MESQSHKTSNKYYLKKTFNLNDSQCDLIIIGVMTFIFQALCLYYINPKKFNGKMCSVCLVLSFIYNIAYFKFFY
jgi:hypothetical protein